MTTSGTGKIRTPGFTILEVLLVLFLIAMMGTLLIVNIDTAFRDQEESTVEHAFWDASREGRLQALYNRRAVTLTYDAESGAFQLESGGASLGSYEADRQTRDGKKIEVAFVQQRARNELVLIRGEIRDTRPVREVVFYPDGSCTSFWLEITFGGERRQIRIDPWTGAEMLVKAE